MIPIATNETKLRFRIRLLLAERDMTVANLYQLVKQQGFDISSSHFFRQMTPYPNAIRPELLVAVCKALGCEASELFDLVDVVSESEPKQKPRVVTPKATKPKEVTDTTADQEVEAAKRKAEDKRKSALLGPKVAVLGLKKR